MNRFGQENSRRYEAVEHYRPYPAPPADFRPREPRDYASGSNASYRSGGPIRSSDASSRAPSSRPKADPRDMDLQAVIGSSRPGSRRDRPLPPPRSSGPRPSGPQPRSRASLTSLDAAMDDYWNQDDDGAAASPPVCSVEG
jgi:hypothetical protein